MKAARPFRVLWCAALLAGCITHGGSAYRSNRQVEEADLQTSAPTTVSSAYTWHGCQIYPVNDWFTTDLIKGGSSYATSSVDPNSAAIIATLNADYPNSNFSYIGNPANFAAAAATNSTPRYTVRNTTMLNDPYNDDPDNTIPWVNGWFIEGTSGVSDGRAIVLNTETCVDYEAYASSWAAPNGPFSASNGYVHNVNHPLNDQYANDGTRVTAAGLPVLGETNTGEDASLSSINHIANLIMPQQLGVSRYGYVAPATFSQYNFPDGGGHPVHYGDRLRLHSSYSCPSAESYPQAHIVCVQLQHYGAIVNDIEGGPGGNQNFGLRFGETSTGYNPWNTNDLNQLFNNLHITDFDVMTEGPLRCTGSPCD